MHKPGRSLIVLCLLLAVLASPAGAGLLHATFVGGDSYDGAMDIARDGAGAVVVAGETYSIDFPTTPGAYDSSIAGGYDIFVLKLSPDLSTLVASTYVGGSDGDFFYEGGRCLALDGSGNSLIAGITWSADFPTTADSFAPWFNGGSYDGFVVKLSADLGSLLYASFIGGTGIDGCSALTLDAGSRVILVGYTSSEDFPVPLWAFQPQMQGWIDAFLMRLSPDLRILQASTFLGGGDWQNAVDVAIAEAGNLVVLGYTDSSDFPVTAGAYDTTKDYGQDIFVLELTRDARELVASTFLGGEEHDCGRAVGVDAGGAIWVLGGTTSRDFPTTPGAFNPNLSGGEEEGDLVVCRFSPDLSALEASTFLGGPNDDYGEGLAVDGFGDVWVTGRAWWGFPTTVGAEPATPVRGFNVCLAKLSPDVGLLLYSCLLGGTDFDVGRALSFDSEGKLLLAGSTSSDDFPVTPGAYDTTINSDSSNDAFIAVLEPTTLATRLACTPKSGTLPFTCQIGTALKNQTRFPRSAGMRLDLQLASGTLFEGWKSSVRDLEPGETYVGYFSQALPAMAALVGENVIRLSSTDITPPPYNQPPYPPSGDAATDACTITAAAP